MAPKARDPRGLRTGFTTGACAAAAARAATRCLVRGTMLTAIETTLPNRSRVTFALSRCERAGDAVTCGVIKDAGDDPDCTHGAELLATVSLRQEAGVELRGGAGVAVVTRPGLGLEVGTPAINPVPRRNITELVEQELAWTGKGAVVTLSVPGGAVLAEQTTNARLGLLGGISILGTTGIVKPYSTAAYKASVVQAIDVAIERGVRELVLTTGGKSEAYAMQLLPALPVEAFIQVGDFVGVGLRHCARRGATRAVIVGMMGKLSKMADGKMQTHAAGSEVNLALLSELAGELGADAATRADIAGANTARHVLELCAARGLAAITSLVCARVVAHARRHAGGTLDVRACLVDFGGALLGQHPSAAGGLQPNTVVAPKARPVVQGGDMNDMRQLTARGRSIEDGSFRVIDAEAGAHRHGPSEWQITRRVIHATADFEFKDLMRFHPEAVRAGIVALCAGCPVVVDVKMITAGLNEERLGSYGCQVHCFISDDDVIAAASAQNSTRAIEAMRKAHRLGRLDGAVVAVGNAPTALLEVVRLVREERARPALVVGVPVGFVAAAESKQAVLALPGLPSIVAQGRKGGSTIAVAILHALLLLSTEGAS